MVKFSSVFDIWARSSPKNTYLLSRFTASHRKSVSPGQAFGYLPALLRKALQAESASLIANRRFDISNVLKILDD